MRNEWDSKWDTSEDVLIPENPRASFDVMVNMNSVWEGIQDRAEYREVSPLDLITSLLTFGHEFLEQQEGDSISIRNSMGYEDPLSLLDERFDYQNQRHLDNSKPREVIITIPSRSRDIYMDAANRNGIDVEELTARMIKAGLYAMVQKDSNKARIVQIKAGERKLYRFGIKRVDVQKVWEHLTSNFPQTLIEGPKSEDGSDES